MKKGNTIGRTLGRHTDALDLEDADLAERIIELPSGKAIMFISKHIKAGDVEKLTRVPPKINERDQNTITEGSVQDIVKTIKSHQWFPVIAKYSDNKKTIDILDGSRRRYAAIIAGAGLDVLLADEESDITEDEAKALAKEIQTAKEHSIRDLGVSLLHMSEGGMTQGEIAKIRGLSQAKVCRALIAAKVPHRLICLFPDPNDLSHLDYNTLLKGVESTGGSDAAMNTLISDLSSAKEDILSKDPDQSTDATKTTMLIMFKKAVKLLGKPDKKTPNRPTPIYKFDDKNRTAKKQVKEKKHIYEFNRLSLKAQKDIDKAILEVLEKHYPA